MRQIGFTLEYPDEVIRCSFPFTKFCAILRPSTALCYPIWRVAGQAKAFAESYVRSCPRLALVRDYCRHRLIVFHYGEERLMIGGGPIVRAYCH